MNELPINLVVSDLDGTLLNPQHRISGETAQVVRDLVDSGINFVIATGRHFRDVAGIIEGLGRNIPLITSNGAMLHDKHGKLLHSACICPEIAKETLQLSNQYQVHRNIYCGNFWYADAHDERILAMHESGFSYEVTDFGSFEPEHVLKLYFIGERKDLLMLREAVEARFGDALNVTFSLKNTLEVMNGQVSKASALQKLLSRKNISAERTIAFGDGLNDLEMLRYVGHRVVMENAQEELKAELTDYQTTKSNAQDGVAHYLRQQLMQRPVASDVL